MNKHRNTPCGKCRFFGGEEKPNDVYCTLIEGVVTTSQECVSVSCAFRKWYSDLTPEAAMSGNALVQLARSALRGYETPVDPAWVGTV